MPKFRVQLVIGVSAVALFGLAQAARAQVVGPGVVVPRDFPPRVESPNDTVPIEIVALQLMSAEPITVVMPVNQKACRINGVGNVIVVPVDTALPETIPMIPIVPESADPDRAELEELIGLALREAGILPEQCLRKHKPFLLPIEDVFSIRGRGTVGTGRVER